MSQLMTSPPYTPVEAVTEVLHGVAVTDPYRWLEDQESPRTREWLSAQQQYARSYLDAIPGREKIRERIRELLDVETYDSIQKAGSRYFFRKRSRRKEQPCIFFREGLDGADQLIVDPEARGTGVHTAVKPLLVSRDSRLLLYEVKEGGERAGTFEILDIENRSILPDVLPRGYLRGFSFASDSKSFYYVHEALTTKGRQGCDAYHHVLGCSFDYDRKLFSTGEQQNARLHIIPGNKEIGFLVLRFPGKAYTDFYLRSTEREEAPRPVIKDAEYRFGPVLLADGRILAMTDQNAPNFRIVEVCYTSKQELRFQDLIPASDSRIQNWTVTHNRIFVSYLRGTRSQFLIFDLVGNELAQLPVEPDETIHLLETSPDSGEVFVEKESFTKPLQTWHYSSLKSTATVWAERRVPFDSQNYSHAQVCFPTKDGTSIPMSLVGRREVVNEGSHPAIMTAYGGYGRAMTPQFSVLVAFLLERGCLFALPNIRGGSEFGVEWHDAAKRRNRQVAFEDFLTAAEWLIETGRTEPTRLAIFGGSNSGLLVAAAMTQRPSLFRAVVCMVPLLDMLRYHMFDSAHLWKEEFGTSDDPSDFAALLSYSPYHQVRDGTDYPATMIVSGDTDQKCNPLHARKMSARLQAANTSAHPVLLDYSRHRGHSPVLPLSDRIEGLTNRIAFLCDQLNLPV